MEKIKKFLNEIGILYMGSADYILINHSGSVIKMGLGRYVVNDNYKKLLTEEQTIKKLEKRYMLKILGDL